MLRPVIALLAILFASPALAQPAVPAFGSFLGPLGGQKSKVPRGPQAHELALPLNYGPEAFLDYRFIKGRQLYLKRATATSAFAEECNAHGGRIHAPDFDQSRLAYGHFMSGGGGMISVSLSFDFSACTDAQGNPLAVLTFLNTSDSRWAEQLAIYILTPASARSALTAQQDRVDREAAFQDRIRQGEAADLTKWTAWRQALTIGTETNCGPVIELRGAMVEIGVPASLRRPNAPSQIWIKREDLYPLGAQTHLGWPLPCRSI